jgi:hypothetical protein
LTLKPAEKVLDMQPRDRSVGNLAEHIANAIPDLQLQMFLFMEPMQLRESGLLSQTFDKYDMRYCYYQTYYNRPRATGAKKYSISLEEYLATLRMLRTEGKLLPEHSELPQIEELCVKAPQVPRVAPPTLASDANNHSTVSMMSNEALEAANLYRMHQRTKAAFQNMFFEYHGRQANPVRYTYEYLLTQLLDKWLSVDFFDPPRFGDFVSIDLDDTEPFYAGFLIFFVHPTSPGQPFGFEFGAPVFEETVLLPKDIVLGKQYPINYYEQLGWCLSQIDITEYRNEILNNIIRTKFTSAAARNPCYSFVEYLEVNPTEIPESMAVDSVNEADSSLIVMRGNDLKTGGFQEKNVRIGLNSEGRENEIGDGVPPSVSFAELIQNSDIVYGHVTIIDCYDNTVENRRMFIELEEAKEAQKYYTPSQYDDDEEEADYHDEGADYDAYEG